MTITDITDLLASAATIYGATCVAFNALVALAAQIIDHLPHHDEHASIDHIYNAPWYKAVAPFFSWGDYAMEYIRKRKANNN